MDAGVTQNPRVLFVDDEPSVTSAFRVLLRRAPYEVLVANSARDALALLAQTQVDVVVSDMDMPDMGGSEFLARVRSHHPRTTRVVLSGRAKLEDTIHAINDAAVFRFLVKPCPPAELIKCIEDALAARRTRRPTTTPPMPSEAELLFDRGLQSLWVATQPIVSVRERRTIAFEALVRSREPQLPHGGAIMELAERLGRVREIERLIRVHAGEVAARLPDDTMLLVNLHPSALEDPDLLAEDSPLARFPDRVAFEITERARLKPEGPAWDAIRALRQRGHRIAVDDLGAGYAGLTSLVTLQPDIVKLDMELIRNVDTSPTRSKLVASLVALSKQLDVRVIAEGVESAAECQHLLGLGCDWMQGYFFARPGTPFPLVNWPAELAA
jgi:EAL domain-containing protein (putative c-di-GMP-specific phosphodiesterase class I)